MADSETAARRKRLAFLILAGLLGLAWAGPLFGFPSLALGWFERGDRLIHRVHDLGYGIWATLFMAVGYLSQLLAPERQVAAFQQLLLALLAFAVAAAVSADYAFSLPFAAGFVLLTVILGALHPARGDLRLRAWRPSPPLLVVALAAAIPLTIYALQMAGFQRAGPPSDAHVEERHWVTMATLALSIWLVGGLAGLRTPGWRIPAWSAGLAAAVFGVASMVFPAYPGSIGATWGLVALIGGVLFVAVAEWEALRRTDRKPASVG